MRSLREIAQRTCLACSGTVAHNGDGDIICSLPEPIECVVAEICRASRRGKVFPMRIDLVWLQTHKRVCVSNIRDKTVRRLLES